MKVSANEREAGVPLVRVGVAAEYSASELAERINAAITAEVGRA